MTECHKKGDSVSPETLTELKAMLIRDREAGAEKASFQVSLVLELVNAALNLSEAQSELAIAKNEVEGMRRQRADWKAAYEGAVLRQCTDWKARAERAEEAYENMRAWANGIDTASYGLPAVDKSAGSQTEVLSPGGCSDAL